MAQTVLITLTIAGTDTGPFDLYSDADGYTSPFETGISKASLTSGYTSSAVPNPATFIKVASNGICTNSITLPIIGTSASTSTSTSTSSSSSSSTTSTSTTVAATVRIYAKYINNQFGTVEYSVNGGVTWTSTSLSVSTTTCALFTTLTGLPVGSLYLRSGGATISICKAPSCITCPGFGMSDIYGCPEVNIPIINGNNDVYITIDGSTTC